MTALSERVKELAYSDRYKTYYADLLLELILWIRDEPSNRGYSRLEKMQKYGV